MKNKTLVLVMGVVSATVLGAVSYFTIKKNKDKNSRNESEFEDDGYEEDDDDVYEFIPEVQELLNEFLKLSVNPLSFKTVRENLDVNEFIEWLKENGEEEILNKSFFREKAAEKSITDDSEDSLNTEMCNGIDGFLSEEEIKDLIGIRDK